MHTEYISDLFWFFIKSNVYYFSKNYSVLLKALSFLSENEGASFQVNGSSWHYWCWSCVIATISLFITTG